MNVFVCVFVSVDFAELQTLSEEEIPASFVVNVIIDEPNDEDLELII